MSVMVSPVRPFTPSISMLTSLKVGLGYRFTAVFLVPVSFTETLQTELGKNVTIELELPAQPFVLVTVTV